MVLALVGTFSVGFSPLLRSKHESILEYSTIQHTVFSTRTSEGPCAFDVGPESRGAEI